MKNRYFVMFIMMSGLTLHASDDGDRKNVVAAREDVDQKKVAAAFNILFDQCSEASRTYGAGLPKALVEKTVDMLEEWERQDPITRDRVHTAKFFDRAGILCSRAEIRNAALLDFVDCRGKSVEILNLSAEGHTPNLQFSACANSSVPVFAAWRDEKLDIISFDTLEPKRTLRQRDLWKAVEITLDGNQIMTGFNRYGVPSAVSLTMLDVETAAGRVQVLDDGLLESAKLSPDGNFIASGTRNTTFRKDQNLVRIFDVRSAKPAARELVCQSNISDMSFINNGKELVVAENSEGGAITTWDLGTGRKKQTIAQGAQHIAIDAAGTRLVSCDKSVLLWDLSQGSKIAQFNADNNSFKACDISADGNAILAVPNGRRLNSLQVWTKSSLKTQLGEIQARRIVQARRTAGSDNKTH